MHQSKREQKSTLRRCALTRQIKPTTDLVRFVLSPDNIIVPDIDAKAGGKGIWISLSNMAVKEAARKKIFSEILSSEVNLPEDLAQLVQKHLQQRLLGSLGLARKAGQLVIGATKTLKAIEKGNIKALIIATNSASDMKEKILHNAKTKLKQQSYLLIDFLSSEQLSLALGQENVVYGALISGTMADSALKRADRVVRYLRNNGLQTIR